MIAMIDKIAWIHLVEGKVLTARSHGKDTYYFPGGKREAGETDNETLIREIEEELTVHIQPDTIQLFGKFAAEAHGKEAGVQVQMTCLTADYSGTLSPAAEIAELAWLSYNDRDKVSAVSRLIFDQLHEMKLL
ncbi:NUDIX hydrolase [Paenibacillus ihuae]|uniref:NUDIX hydrolase n=1 Tax=Paenibacillus ihuae TaxID=1232431 RepID=UPI0006D566A5|nr:NUDIX domain-containing protein [Paenibacillus ihuae]